MCLETISNLGREIFPEGCYLKQNSIIPPILVVVVVFLNRYEVGWLYSYFTPTGYCAEVVETNLRQIWGTKWRPITSNEVAVLNLYRNFGESLLLFQPSISYVFGIFCGGRRERCKSSRVYVFVCAKRTLVCRKRNFCRLNERLRDKLSLSDLMLSCSISLSCLVHEYKTFIFHYQMMTDALTGILGAAPGRDGSTALMNDTST